MKFKLEHLCYLAVMVAAFAVLDLLGVSHLDKLGLAALVGIVAPLYCPTFAARLLNAH